MTNSLNVVEYMNIYKVRLPTGSLCQMCSLLPAASDKAKRSLKEAAGCEPIVSLLQPSVNNSKQLNGFKLRLNHD